MTAEGAKAGRPRVWTDTRTRQRAYQQRQREKMRLIDDLLLAARNAHWEEPELYRRISKGDDAEVLEALTEHYQARHWQLFLPPVPRKAAVRKTKEGIR